MRLLEVISYPVLATPGAGSGQHSPEQPLPPIANSYVLHSPKPRSINKLPSTAARHAMDNPKKYEPQGVSVHRLRKLDSIREKTSSPHAVISFSSVQGNTSTSPFTKPFIYAQMNDDDEISPSPVQPTPSKLAPPSELNRQENLNANLEETFSVTTVSKFEHDAEKDSTAAPNPFAFSPTTLDKLLNLKSLSAFYAFGGLHGLEIGLRTNRNCGLGIDETVLHDHVTFADVKAALTGASVSGTKTTNAPSALERSATMRSSSTHGQGQFADRKRIFNDNRLPATSPKSFLHLLWAAYNDPVLMLLTAAAIVSLAIGLYQTFDTPHNASNPPVEWVEGVAIIIAIIVIVLVGSVNDYEKERQFLKLNVKKQSRDVKVIRSGKSREISVFDVLVGDVVHLEPGDVIPADGVFIDGHSIKCDESSITGESDPIRKHPADQVFQAIQNRSYMDLHTLDPFIISGSKVAEGVGTFLVTATGTNSSHGRVLGSLRDDPEVTPLQLRLEKLAKKISITGAVLALTMFVVTFIKFCVQLRNNHNSPAEKGQLFLNVLIISLTVLVIAVPEGLPLAVMLALAFATRRMLKDNNLVRRLKSCETMGNATTICSDKTGTLTQNEMKVVTGVIGRCLQFAEEAEEVSISSRKDELFSSEKTSELAVVPNVRPSSLSARLSNDVRDLLQHLIAINSTAFESDDNMHPFTGSKTETALLTFARHHLGLGSVSVERSNTTTVYFMPFYAIHKCMAVVVKLSSNKYRLYVKGAPEILLAASTRIVSDCTERLSDRAITAEDTDYLKGIIASYASCSLRTIGLVYRDFDSWPDSEAQVNVDEILRDFVFLSVMGIQDPLRPEAKESVRLCQHAGVIVRMVTGDNILTAKAIAKECGILGTDGTAMQGEEFRNLSTAQLKAALPKLRVIARASPEDKRLLVTQLRGLGEVVAVTGDGTNDTLALAAADIGFSMGISGTEVAKEAAAIILIDDNFASIVNAIMWGRVINDAVKKFLQFQVTITVTSVALAFISAVSSSQEQSVLTPVQLMWVNLVQDTLAALALATDSPSRNILDRKPEPKLAPLITPTMWKMIIGQSVYQLAVTLVLYFGKTKILGYHSPHQQAQLQTVVFSTYVWMQIFNQYNCRRIDNKFNILEGVLRNWLFLSISALMIGCQILILFVGGRAFSIARLDPAQWAYSLVLGALSIPVGAVIKLIRWRGRGGSDWGGIGSWLLGG